jgi:hypothetical protein
MSRSRLVVAGLVLVALAGCSSDDTPDTTMTAPVTVEARATEAFKIEAQFQLGRSIPTADYECVEPTSAEPGTQFTCAAELDGNELHFVAEINADGTVTLTQTN